MTQKTNCGSCGKEIEYILRPSHAHIKTRYCNRDCQRKAIRELWKDRKNIREWITIRKEDIDEAVEIAKIAIKHIDNGNMGTAKGSLENLIDCLENIKYR